MDAEKDNNRISSREPGGEYFLGHDPNSFSTDLTVLKLPARVFHEHFQMPVDRNHQRCQVILLIALVPARSKTNMKEVAF